MIDGKDLKRICYEKFRRIMRYEKTRNDCVGCATEKDCWPAIRCPQCRGCEKLGQCDDGRGCIFYLEFATRGQSGEVVKIPYIPRDPGDDIGDQYGDRDNPALDVEER